MKQIRYIKHIAVAIIAFLEIFSAVYAQSPTPGGVSGQNYRFAAWLTPDGYIQNGNSGTWHNNFTDGASVGNFTTVTTNRTPVIDNSWGYNFHPSVLFTKNSDPDAASRMRSANSFNLGAGNISIFFVLRDGRPASGVGYIWYNIILTFHNGAKDNSAIGWWNNTSGNIRYPAVNNTIVLNSAKEGMLAFDNANGTGGLYTWLNGNTGAAQGLARTALNYNDKLTIGENGNNEYGFRGNIQEMIVVSSGATGTLMSIADRQKIHSYLAVKYGITLGAAANIGGGDYVNSDGTVIWNRALNTGFQQNVFGIARDDASRLNQVQSRSNASGKLTMYKGALGTFNNNNSAELTDKTAVMLGSNDGSTNSNIAYQQFIGTVFDNGTLNNRINFHTPLIYRAQVTTAGVKGGAQTVHLRVESDRMQYVFVSNNQLFTTGVGGGTRFYPISGRTATILVEDGNYITFGGFEPLPGGIAGYNLDLWVSGDNSTNNSWENIAASAYSLQKFSTSAPVVRNSKLNFHRELFFGNTKNSKLRTDANYTITAGQAYYAFVVSENNTKNEAILLSYNASTSAAEARRTSLRWSTDKSIMANWGNTTSNATNTVTGLHNFGIASMNILNTGNSANSLSLSGTTLNAVPSTQQNIGVPLLVGNGHTSATTGTILSLNGSIQEIILMKGAARLTAPEVARIHSYLAIKYGITLTSGDYLSSDGNVVWSRTANAGFTNNIFGIARDNESGLYQKQSKSTSFPSLTIFINGSTLKTLNAENTGTLEDKQYFIAGSNGGAPIQPLSPPIDHNTVYLHGNTAADTINFNISTPIYKAQWSGFGSNPVKVSMKAHRDFYYVQLSTNANFTPSATKVYPVIKEVAEVEFDGAFQYFRFIGFSPGPGGITQGLRLWLCADDEPTLTVASVDVSGGTAKTLAAGYPEYKSGDAEVTVVTAWKDMVRDHLFDNSHAEILPVLKYNCPEMNYHPALTFWATKNAPYNNNNTYLSNIKGNIMSTKQPTEHTAIFAANLNSIFSPGDPGYLMMFGTATMGNYDGPGYAIDLNNQKTRVVGRFRTSGASGQYNGQRELYSFGSTSVLGYYQKNSQMEFRFNGAEETVGFNWNFSDMTKPLRVGTGWQYDRTLQGVMSEVIFYERALPASEKAKVESYLALKYGITLYPDNTPTHRFDYLFSDSTVIWKGNIAPSDPVHGTFAKHYCRVAAIIRDDAARLDNRHSHSTNVGSLLHLGVAGTQLSDDGSMVGYCEYNMEAVAFGDNDSTGVSPNNSNCGKFEFRFNRIWLIHKMTQQNRPISLLVGAQNNSQLSIGRDDRTKDYYYELQPTNDVYLIVGASPEDIENGNYTAVVPMVLINREFQAIYTFKENDTYITFGYRPNITGCYSPEDAQFQGTKTFQWTQYTSRTNRTNRNMSGQLTIPKVALPAVDLGDNIIIDTTKLVYPAPIRPSLGYPRTSNYPVKGSLEVRRSSGAVNQEVLVTIKFAKPVMPSFSISGIDDYRYRSYDEVTITGNCSGATHNPLLTAANRTPSYKITGNTATANIRARLAGNNKNGMVDVEFKGAVESINIRYRLQNKVTGTQRIFISPITLQATAPPPPINEDGIGFTKCADVTDVTTCEAVTYTFHFINTNCDDKYVDLIDELNPNMKWVAESLGMDTGNNWHNSSLRVHNYEGITTLQIDSLVIPGASEIKIKATAVFDENAPSDEYISHALATYSRYTYLLGALINTEKIVLPGGDVSVYVESRQRQGKVQVEVITKPTYSEDTEFDVTYKITNPNSEITKMFMNFDFNENFYYVTNSFHYYSDDDPTAQPAPGDPVLVTDGDWQQDVTDKTNNYLCLAGSAIADTGFTLKPGVCYILFKIKTPVFSALDDEYDEIGQPTGKKEALSISHSFFSEMDDPCFIEALQGSDNAKIVYFAKRKTHIPTNKNLTGKLKK